MAAQLEILWGVLRDPRTGFGRVIDQGSLLFAFCAFVLAALPLVGFSPCAPLFLLCAGFVPGLILGASLTTVAPSFGRLFRRDYGAALACSLVSAAIALAPVSLASFYPPLFFVLRLVSPLAFLTLTVFSARTLWGLGYPASSACGAIGLLGAYIASWLYPMLGSRSLIMILVLLVLIFSDDLLNAFRERGSLRRRLDAAATNPHDADAQFQLGELYEQRRNTAEALVRYQNAVRIDPDLAEAHYALGRIALDQQRAVDALAHFTRAAALDDKLSGSEVWRSIGAAHLAAGRPEEAESALRKFTARREHDPQGLYLLGEALERQSKPGAREFYLRCVEAADTAASYRKRELSSWKRNARAKLASGRE